MSVDTENKNGVKENVDGPQQLLQPSVASSDGSLPDEDEGVFAQPSMTMQQQSAGPASLIFIASSITRRARVSQTKMRILLYSPLHI